MNKCLVIRQLDQLREVLHVGDLRGERPCERGVRKARVRARMFDGNRLYVPLAAPGNVQAYK